MDRDSTLLASGLADYIDCGERYCGTNSAPWRMDNCPDCRAKCADVERIVGDLMRAAQRDAWLQGHLTYQQLGPDDCECEARSEDECGCGQWGSNVVTPNPYGEGRTP